MLLTHDYYCPKIGMASEFRVVMPDGMLQNSEKPAGVLFLLPKEGESGSAMISKTDLPSLCASYRIAAVVPPCLEGCYTDMVYGYPFYQSLKYIREYLRNFLPGIPLESGKCMIAGFGAGGFAALRWAMEEPDFFACTGSIRGILDPAMPAHGYFTERRLTDLFGSPEERREMREEFLSSCRSSAVRNVYLITENTDPGYESSSAAGAAFGGRASLKILKAGTGSSEYKDPLDRLVRIWLGGER